MKNITSFLLVIIVGFGGVVLGDDARELDELNAMMDRLNMELSELTLKIQAIVSEHENDTQKGDSGSSKSTENKEKVISEMQEAIVRISNDQLALAKEIKKVKDRVIPHQISNDEMDQVYVGESKNDNAAVLYNYGDANEDPRDVRYVDDYYDDPNERTHMYFDNNSDYYESWEGPWAVDPPYWLRRKEYWRKRR